MKRTLFSLTLSALVLGIAAPISAVANPARTTEIQNNARQRAADAREDKETKVAEIKAATAARKLQLRQDRCEMRETRLQALLPKLANGATRHKAVIDKIYEHVTGFYASGQLTVQNYEELVNAIELAKADAEASLVAVDEYEFELDCEDPDTGEQLDAFRTAISDTRGSLKEYRKAVVELISSLQNEHSNANQTGDTENTEEEQEETEDENEQE